MKYVANPVIADAWEIEKIYTGRIPNPKDAMAVHLKDRPDGPIVGLTHAMISRYVPVVGDYYVVQEDAYAYVNPKQVFEHKYTVLEPDDAITVAFGAKLEPNGDVTRVRITKGDKELLLTPEQAKSLANQINGRPM